MKSNYQANIFLFAFSWRYDSRAMIDQQECKFP